MSLEHLLVDKRSAIVRRWCDLVFSSYPIDTQRFLEKEKNRFSNPVGRIIAENLEVLYDELTCKGDMDNIARCLDQIIRIRAVQDFTPSEAVNFLFSLKKLIKDELKNQEAASDFFKGMEWIEDRIDTAALLAFDIYSQCQQKICELKVNESRNQLAGLLKKANRMNDLKEKP
jgi:hypothetical protein